MSSYLLLFITQMTTKDQEEMALLH